MTMKLQFNFFCADIEAQLDFYVAVLGLPEVVHTRSAIYRSVGEGDLQFGFHADPAFDLLGLRGRQPPAASHAVDGYPTFVVESTDGVDEMAALAPRHGGSVIKGPFATYYGQWQVVLADPEGHVVRIACERLPAGVEQPSLRVA